MKHLLGLLLGLLLFVGWTPSGMCATAADGQQANLGLFIRDLEAFDILMCRAIKKTDAAPLDM